MRSTVFTPVVGCVCAAALATGTMIGSSEAHVATTFRINLNACIVVLLDERKIRIRLERYPVLSERSCGRGDASRRKPSRVGHFCWICQGWWKYPSATASNRKNHLRSQPARESLSVAIFPELPREFV